MRLAAKLLVLLCLALFAPLARAETLIASLSTTRVQISSNYTGSSVVVFGAIERDAQTISRASPYEAVVTVRGPRQTLTVREKRQIGPIWVNRKQRVFPNVPVFLAVLSSAPLAEVTTDALRWRFQVGLEAIVESPAFPAGLHDVDDPFRDALLRLEDRDGLYFQDEKGVSFLTSSIFRAAVPVPATAPPGNYEVEVALFADKVLLSRGSTSFQLVKAGFEQQVAEIARNWSVAYGAGTAGVALLFGWLASIIFRRD